MLDAMNSAGPLHEPAQSEPGPVAAYAPPADASTSGSAAPAGRLWVSSRPWGLLMVDGQFVGHTPAANVPLTAGAHSVSIVRDGFQPFQQHIQVAPGDTVRLVDIVLLAAAR